MVKDKYKFIDAWFKTLGWYFETFWKDPRVRQDPFMLEFEKKFIPIWCQGLREYVELNKKVPKKKVKDDSSELTGGRWVTVGAIPADPETGEGGRKGKHIYVKGGEIIAGNIGQKKSTAKTDPEEEPTTETTTALKSAVDTARGEIQKCVAKIKGYGEHQKKCEELALERAILNGQLKNKKWLKSNKTYANLVQQRAEKVKQMEQDVKKFQIDHEDDFNTIAQHVHKVGKIAVQEVRNAIIDKGISGKYRKSREAYEKARKALDDKEAEINKPTPPGVKFDIKQWKAECDKMAEDAIDTLQEYYLDMLECREVVFSKLKELRPKLGASDKTRYKNHIQGKASQEHKDLLEMVYEFFPTEWVDNSQDAGIIKLIDNTKRGYYCEQNGELSLGNTKRKTVVEKEETAFHELGHRFAHKISGLMDQEKVFYEKRTKGYPLERLRDVTGNPNYSPNEMTREDKFLNPYIGKDYNGDAYELMSMGCAYIGTDIETLLDDEDYAEFILGSLLTI